MRQNKNVKIMLVLVCPRAHDERDVRQVTGIIAMKLTRARQIIQVKNDVSRKRTALQGK